jgi:hypothetical protein
VRGRADDVTANDESLFIVPVSETVPLDVDSTASGAYDPDTALRNTPDIDTDLDLSRSATASGCILGTPFKLPSDGNLGTQDDSTVYYCGRDGKRYAFLNAKIYASWFQSFKYILTTAQTEMAKIPLGGVVKYRPGKRLIKSPFDPKVYAVSRGGLLRWVSTESEAAALYGPHWAAFVDDLPEAFVGDYRFGEQIAE